MRHIATYPVLLSIALAATARGQDCNANGIDDALDIANGTSADCDANAVPDECDLAGGEVFFTDFDSPLPPGISLTMTGIWHVGSVCRPAGSCGADDFAYFGDDANCDFDVGLPPSGPFGTLVLSGIQLPNAQGIELSFCSYYEGEGGAFNEPDQASVWIQQTGAGGQPTLLEYTSTTDNMSTWEQRQIDLSAHAGLTVDLLFEFDAWDESFNWFFGWGIDDVRITFDRDLNDNGVLDDCECTIESTCVTAPNSVGPGAAIGALGTSMIGRNDLVLTASGLPSGQIGIFFYGPMPAQIPFGNGILCLTGPILRLPAVGTANGSTSFAFDNASPVHDPGDHVFAGAQHNFQFWYRDPDDGGAGFNLTDALEILFCP